MDEYNIFVRINYRDIEEKRLIDSSHTKVNNRTVNGSKYLIGGGILNKKRGGSVIFTARSLQEIKEFTEKKPLGKNSILQYNVGIIPKEII